MNRLQMLAGSRPAAPAGLSLRQALRRCPLNITQNALHRENCQPSRVGAWRKPSDYHSA